MGLGWEGKAFHAQAIRVFGRNDKAATVVLFCVLFLVSFSCSKPLILLPIHALQEREPWMREGAESRKLQRRGRREETAPGEHSGE